MTGSELKELRAKAGVTQATLARKVGLSVEHVSRMETGACKIMTNQACALRYVLDRGILSADYWEGGE